jgi:hypothetical protein
MVSFVSPTHGHEIFGRIYRAKRSGDDVKPAPTILHVYGGPCVQFVVNRCATVNCVVVVVVVVVCVCVCARACVCACVRACVCVCVCVR